MFRKTAFIITLTSLFTGLVGTPASANLSDQWYVGAGYVNSQLLPRAEANEVTRKEDIGQGATVFFGRDFDERSSGQFQLYSLGDVIFSDDSIATYTAADASLLYRFYDSRDSRRNARFGLSVYGRFGFGFIDRDSTNVLRTEGASPIYFGAGGGLETYLSDMFAVRTEMMFHEKDAVSANVSVVARFGGRKSRSGSLQAPRPPTPPASTQPQTTVSPIATPQALPIPTPNERTQASQTNGSDSSSTSELPEVAIMANPQEFYEAESKPTNRQANNDIDNDRVTDDIDQCRQSTPNYPVRQNGCSFFVQTGSQIQFVESSPLPLPQTELILEELAAKMIQFPLTRIELIAHSDNVGDPQAKSSLTRQRLRAIGIYLVQRGISQDRFLLRSFGGKRPAFDNSSAAGRKANNRIEIVERP